MFKKYYDLQAVQKKNLGPTTKKIDPLLLTYLFLFVYVPYESTLLLNFVECVVYAFVYVQKKLIFLRCGNIVFLKSPPKDIFTFLQTRLKDGLLQKNKIW